MMLLSSISALAGAGEKHTGNGVQWPVPASAAFIWVCACARACSRGAMHRQGMSLTHLRASHVLLCLRMVRVSVHIVGETVHVRTPRKCALQAPLQSRQHPEGCAPNDATCCIFAQPT